MTEKRFVVLIVAGLLVVPSRADAYRPFDGTDADVANRGVFELELGPVQYYREGRHDFLVSPAIVLNLGIFEDTEIVIDADQAVALGSLESGTSRVRLLDDDVLLKHVFREGTVQGKTGISLAAEGGVLTPEIGGDAGVGGSLSVITSYQWTWGAAHYSEWLEYTRAHHADLFTGMILEGPHDWVVRPVAEVFYDKDFAAGRTASALVGAIWEVSDTLAFDVGVRGARVDDESLVEARLGLTWSVALLP